MYLKLLKLTLGFSIVCGLQLARAHDFQAGTLRIAHPYAPPSLSSTGAVYFKFIQNEGKADDELQSARSSVATSVALHEMKMEGDVMTMRTLSAIALPAGATIRFAHGQPNGYHLMLMGLLKPLKEGDHFSVWLKFKHAGEKEVMVWVQTPKSKTNQSEHKH